MRIAPRQRPDAAVFDVVVFLNRAVQLTDRRRQHARRKAREVVGEELDPLTSASRLRQPSA